MLKGKTALITGSTSGIGLGIAEGLAKEGVNLVLNGFGDAAEIEALRVRLENTYHVKAIYDGADMSKGEQIEAMMKPQASAEWERDNLEPDEMWQSFSITRYVEVPSGK